MHGVVSQALSPLCRRTAGGCANICAAGLNAADAPATVPAAASTRPAQTPVLAANSIVKNDVPYGTDPLQKMDIYAPKGADHAPVMLFVHGGEWSRGDKLDVSTKPRFLNENGMLFLSMNYRLSPKDPHPAQINDVADGFAWAHSHVAEFGGDPSKIVIMGYSAGCHLVTLLALDPAPLARDGLKPSDIRGIVVWSGAMFDLVAQAQGTGTYPPFIKATFGEDAAGQRAASPLTYVKSAKEAPPFLIASVDAASQQSARDASKQLLDAVNAAGGKAQAALLTGKTHFTASHELGAAGDQTGQILLDFVRSVTR